MQKIVDGECLVLVVAHLGESQAPSECIVLIVGEGPQLLTLCGLEKDNLSGFTSPSYRHCNLHFVSVLKSQVPGNTHY